VPHLLAKKIVTYLKEMPCSLQRFKIMEHPLEHSVVSHLRRIAAAQFIDSERFSGTGSTALRSKR
jgi:hypothetical protein